MSLQIGRIHWATLITLALLVTGAFILLSLAKPARAAVGPSPKTSDEFPGAMLGQALYEGYCITCHGETGSGLEEARIRFPETHQKCERCHRVEFPSIPQYGGEAFSIGNPPALKGLRASGRFASQNALYGFIRATMPRWAPGSLADEEYLALSQYLWEVLGVDSQALEKASPQ